MNTVIEHAYAKLNISLDVLEKMDNGYHAMKMIMQSVTLCDDITITVKDGTGKVRVTTDKDFLPEDGDNIAGKAALVFLKKISVHSKDIDIRIHKRIPVCAGLAGGSTDGAAVLRGLNKLFGIGFRREHLEMLGEEVGSDVPYCIAGGTALAEGRGEVLSDLWNMPHAHVVICKPQFAVSTPVLFRKLDAIEILDRPDTEGLMEYLEKGDLEGICSKIMNVFEEVPEECFEEVRKIKGMLRENGALGAAMSGTGSAVFGVFDDEQKAKGAYKALGALYEECFLCETLDKLKI